MEFIPSKKQDQKQSSKTKNFIMRYISIFLFVFLLNPFKGITQDFDAIVEGTMQTLKKNSYYFDLNYALFKGESGKKIYEEYKGVIALKEGMFYQKIGVMESIQALTFMVKLNHTDKEISIEQGDSFEPMSMINIDLNTINQMYHKGAVKTTEKAYVLELTPKQLEVSQFSKIWLHIDKKSKKFIKQVMLFKQLQDFSYVNSSTSESQYDVGRLEISFVSYDKEIDHKLFEKKRYFEIINNKIKLGKEFQNFKLLSAK